ncbi:hypothetical protein [Variovorax jilinensis]|uniref:hypothetical protein n=1 Tax=Variovorax jilinensis TaxID=3053513 RepID=UPI002578E4E8|nr:hypothetical protein [Variovorax sp. J22P168]
MNDFLLCAALIGMTTSAVGQEREAAAAHGAIDAPIGVASPEAGQRPDKRDVLGPGWTTLDRTLAAESPALKMSIPASNPHQQAWCVEQSQVRPEDSGLIRMSERLGSGCYDRSVAVSGRDLLIYSAFQLAVRHATSFFAE